MATRKKTSETASESASQANVNGQEKDAMVSIGGLWVNTSQNGDMYLAGYLGNAKLYIFKNKQKKLDGQPDYYMTVAPNKAKRDKASREAFEASAKDDWSGDGDDGDDIPF